MANDNKFVKDLADKSYTANKEFLDAMLAFKKNEHFFVKETIYDLILKLYDYFESEKLHRNMVNSTYVDLYNHHCHNIALKMLDDEWRIKANEFRNGETLVRKRKEFTEELNELQEPE